MNNYSEICQQIRSCKRCSLYKDMPDTKPVPGIGPVNADIMLVGEALGKDESLLEEPFVGDCGKYLTNTLLKNAGLKREELYICNTVNCRPTKNNGRSNRPPSQDEIDKCKVWLWLQIQAVNPKVICTLGKVPTMTLLSSQLKKNFTLGKIAGLSYKVDYCNATIVPNWHPSYVMVHGKKEEKKCIEIFKKLQSLV